MRVFLCLGCLGGRVVLTATVALEGTYMFHLAVVFVMAQNLQRATSLDVEWSMVLFISQKMGNIWGQHATLMVTKMYFLIK